MTKQNKDDSAKYPEEEEEQQKVREELAQNSSAYDEENKNEEEDGEEKPNVVAPQPFTTKSSVILEEKKNNFHGMFGDDEEEDEDDENNEVDSEDLEEESEKEEEKEDKEKKEENETQDKKESNDIIKETIKTITNSFALPQEVIDANEETREINQSPTSPKPVTHKEGQQNGTEMTAQDGATSDKKKEPELGDIVALSIAEQYAPKRKRANGKKNKTTPNANAPNKKSRTEQHLPAPQQLHPVDYSQYSKAIKGKVFVLKDKKGTLDLNYGKPKKLAKHQKDTNVPFGKRIVKRKRWEYHDSFICFCAVAFSVMLSFHIKAKKPINQTTNQTFYQK